MKTVVITGSARGFGLAMLKEFRLKKCNVVVCDINESEIKKAVKELKEVEGKGKILSFKADVTKEKDIENLISSTIKETKTIDIWINNAGVNQMMDPIWNLDNKVVNKVIDIDLKGPILCSRLINKVMTKQRYGQIYFVEGFGSNNAKTLGLSIYGTAKRGASYFADSLAFENNEKETGVLVGKLIPGIMITNFIDTSLGDGKKIELDEKTKKIYNILGDYPEPIAKFMVNKMVVNEKNNVKFTWLTSRKATWRFMTAKFNKRDFFKEK